jgi:hypothetical protein
MTKKILVARYATQQDFVRALIAAIPEKSRLKLAGLPTTIAQR